MHNKSTFSKSPNRRVHVCRCAPWSSQELQSPPSLTGSVNTRYRFHKTRSSALIVPPLWQNGLWNPWQFSCATLAIHSTAVLKNCYSRFKFADMNKEVNQESLETMLRSIDRFRVGGNSRFRLWMKKYNYWPSDLELRYESPHVWAYITKLRCLTQQLPFVDPKDEKELIAKYLYAMPL